MKRIKQLIRLIHINFILIKHGLDKIVLSIPLFAPIRFLAYFNPFNWIQKEFRSPGVRIREALIELGPIYVKFGQALSTRNDLFSDDIAEELAKLQDNVPPFPGEIARKIIEEVYGCEIDALFLDFNPVPIASASIAQVHEVILKNGKAAVLKIVRPGIEKTIRQDVSLLYSFARLVERYSRHGKRLHPVKVVAEFEHIIFNELDLLREAANGSQLRRNFENSDLLYIPEIYWPYAREKIIVMERIYGIPISDVAALKRDNVDLKKLAEMGVTIFFTQVFRDSFFHADMHPGNIFVDATFPDAPRYVAIDFGIMGSLSKADQYYLAANFFAFFTRDYKRVAELHLESGWIPADTSLVEFEAMIRTVCEPIFERPLKEISFGRLLMRLFQTGRRFHMEVQPQLALLQKTLFAIEGLGRRLYPDLDLWSTARPFLKKWLKEQSGPKIFLKKMRANFPRELEQLPDLPLVLYDALIALRDSKLRQPPKEVVHAVSTNRKKIFQGVGLGLLIMTALIFVSVSKMDLASTSISVLIGGFVAGIVILFVAL